MMTDERSTRIRIADPTDAGAAARVLKVAFYDGDLAPWLVNDPVERDRIYPEYFEMLVEHGLKHGTIEMTEDGYGVAIWYPVGDNPLPELPGYGNRLTCITRPFSARFVALDDATKRHHPYTRPHHYLALLGVHPSMQRCGHGSRLLRHHHALLDHLGVPAYLEATGALNQALYLRHGYRVHRKPYAIAGTGPLLHPMWREPSPFPTPGGGARTG